MSAETQHPPRLVLASGGIGEIEQKKSRFIARIEPVKAEEDALAFLSEIRKQYWDAKHHCYAYILENPAGGEIRRFSDDGEPTGTAGKPILEVLTQTGLTGVCAVVTRYFGGTLLGTGGLVRAYTQAVQSALENCHISREVWGSVLSLETDYSGLGRIRHALSQRGTDVTDVEYTDKVTCKLFVPAEELAGVRKILEEATNGQIQMVTQQECYYC